MTPRIRIAAACALVGLVAASFLRGNNPDAPRARDGAPTTSAEIPSPAATGGRARAEAVRERAEDVFTEGPFPGRLRPLWTGALDVARQSLEDAKRFRELARCRAGGAAGGCEELVYSALDTAIEYPLRSLLGAGELGLAEISRQMGPEAFGAAVHASAGRVLSDSRDPVERTVALAMLARADVPLPPLPPESLRGLAEAHETEKKLLLDEIANSPSADRGVLDEVALLSTKGGVDVRTKAIRALGASGAAEPLGRGLAALDREAPIGRHVALETVAPALRRCGEGCGDLMLHLSLTGSPMMQLAALSAMGTLPSDSRARLTRDAAGRIDKGKALPSVRRQLEYLELIASN